jgi:hypothetical protein
MYATNFTYDRSEFGAFRVFKASGEILWCERMAWNKGRKRRQDKMPLFLSATPEHIIYTTPLSHAFLCPNAKNIYPLHN